MPGVKLLRRLFIIAAVLGAIFVGANLWLVSFAERQIATVVRTSFGLRTTPSVELEGFPILLSVFRGRLEGIAVEVDGLRVEDLRVASLRVRLEDVDLVGGVLNGSLTTLRVGSGTAVARVEQRSVNAFLRARGEDVTLTLREGSVRARTTFTYLGRERTGVATGRASLRDGMLRFEPRTVRVDGEVPPEPLRSEAMRRSRVAVRIPDLPGGLAPDALEIIPGAARLIVRLADTSIDLSG